MIREPTLIQRSILPAEFFAVIPTVESPLSIHHNSAVHQEKGLPVGACDALRFNSFPCAFNAGHMILA